MPAADRFFRLVNAPGALGLSCDENGLHLGGAALLRRTDAGFEPRPSDEVEALIALEFYGLPELGPKLKIPNKRSPFIYEP